MAKSTILLVWFLLSGLWLRGEESALKIGYEHSPPVQMVDAEGRVRGPVYEVLAEAARRKGIRLEWVHCPEGPDRALRSGKVDLWPLMADLPERRSSVEITPPYLRARWWLVTREDSGIRSMADVRGRQVLRQPGLLAEVLVKRYLPAARVEEWPGLAEALKRVCRGAADSALVAQGTGDHLLLRDQGCDVGQLHVVALPQVQLDFGIGARAGDRRAIRASDELLDSLLTQFDSGAMAGIWLRWGLVVTETRILADYISAQRHNRTLRLLMGLLLAALAVAGWLTVRWRKAQRAAQAAAEAKQAFLANMSHEIRTPMNGVMGLASLLEETDLSNEQREYVATIRQSSRSLLRLLNDVLDVAKLESGAFRLEVASFDLREVAEQVSHLAAPIARAKGLEWRFEWDPELPRGWRGDSGRIRQVLVNLAGNAVKFTQTGGVSLRVDMENGAVRFRVEDTGPGISRESREHIFEKFVQGGAPLSPRTKGTGLGLSICRSLVQQMGGRISLDSEPGRGSIFTVVVPLQPAELADEKEMEKKEAGTLPVYGVRTLVVEDNEVNQLVAQRMLLRLGCVVEIAPDGESALRKLAGGGYDVIFMDCSLPGIDGHEVTRRFREMESSRPRKTPVIAMTAAALEGDRDRCLQSGMDDYLTKPLDLETLGRALHHWSEPVQKRKVPATE
jgi:signal transduction histidine kinase/ActR/RegA family two-component response regulator